jgi:hypothetical protein
MSFEETNSDCYVELIFTPFFRELRQVEKCMPLQAKKCHNP